MNSARRARRALTPHVMTGVACLVLAALVGAAAISTSSAPSSPEGAEAAPAIVGGAGSACPDHLIEIAEVDGGTLCSHGPDPAGTPASPSGSVAPEATSGVQCYGDGTSGERVHLIYAHPSSVNRYSSLKATMLVRAAQMDTMFDMSAGQSGADRHIRFLTDANCNVVVDNVTVSSSALTTGGFSTLVNELTAKGYDDPDRKYLVWAETNNASPRVCYGLATLWSDDRPTADNFNNVRAGYGRVDETCLNSGFDGRVEAHELMHTLGAVQATAPHASTYGHCTDDYDRMCYDDDGAGGRSVSIVCSSSNENRFDCHNDDYFYAAPACGTTGYLANHWNTADSDWLERAPATGSSAPGNDQLAGAQALGEYTGTLKGTNRAATGSVGEPAHAGQAGGASVWYRWTAPVSGPVTFDTCGSDVDTLLGVYVGSTSSYTSLQQVASNDDAGGLSPQSRATFTATEGTTYLVAVDGKGGERSSLSLRWGAPPSGYTDVPLGIWYEQAVNWAKAEGLLRWIAGSTFSSKAAANRGQVAYMLWLMMGSPTGAPPHGFSDVASNAYYNEAVAWAKDEGLVTGYPDNTYRPGNGVNRAQIVSMLWNMVGRPGGSPAHGFSDVPASAWYSAALDWAKAQGLVTGYPGNQYKPKISVNRAQLSSMLLGLASSPAAWGAYGSALPETVVF